MIFVTVGTHEQPFNRLIEEVDRLVKRSEITEKVVMQTGYSTYTAQHCDANKFYSYDEMEYFIQTADIVICHGGPSTFMSVINKGKIPIVVPRLVEFGEHVNNHQLDFVEQVIKRGYTIKVIKDISNLKKEILINQTSRFNSNISNLSNNTDFNKHFIEIVKELKEF